MRFVLGAVVGAALGYLWHRVSGGACTTNTCPITGNPWVSSVYGAVMGLLMMGNR